jgi:hypothetical protein
VATIKNSTSNVRPWRITPENVADFRRAMELQGDGHTDPVHCDEYREIGERLFRSFDCLLWIDDILLIEEWRPPADYDLPEYERAYAIRKALEKAAGLQKPHKRPVVRSPAKRVSDIPESARNASSSRY